MTWKSQSKFRQRTQELGVVGPSHNYKMAPRAPSWSTTLGLRHVFLTRLQAEKSKVGGTIMSLPTTTKWQQRAPSWSTTLGVRHVSYTERRRSSRRARIQEELNMIHYPRAAACMFTRLRAEESSDFIEAHCGLLAKNLMKLYYICTCVFFDLWYFRVRVSLRMWKEIWRPVRSLTCTAQIHIPYLCIWINHHTEFVAIQSRARINLDGHSNYITDTAFSL